MSIHFTLFFGSYNICALLHLSKLNMFSILVSDTLFDEILAASDRSNFAEFRSNLAIFWIIFHKILVICLMHVVHSLTWYLVFSINSWHSFYFILSDSLSSVLSHWVYFEIIWFSENLVQLPDSTRFVFVAAENGPSEVASSRTHRLRGHGFWWGGGYMLHCTLRKPAFGFINTNLRM